MGEQPVLETGLVPDSLQFPEEAFTDLTQYQRLTTLPVKVGDLTIGGDYPIRIQSMTTAAPDDIPGLVAEIQALQEAGAELVRLTVPSLKAVRSLETVKARLDALGLNLPLVADVHFTPKAALEAARIVEKVRINPGNYVDKKRFATVALKPQEYEDELKRIEEKLFPLLSLCKKHHTALRIGVNHGSLSDRIVTRYGDSPYGMTQSALEFLTIAEKHDFNQIILSMKSSNPVTMVHAYRLLVQAMKASGLVYPLHLGVTEAGDGELGRIKSATGMAALLTDGIGDTIRVSLTEDAIYEIPVCKKIRALSAGLQNQPKKFNMKVKSFHFYDFARRESDARDGLGANHVPKVLLSSPFKVNYPPTQDDLASLSHLGLLKRSDIDKWETGDYAPDGFFVKTLHEAATLPPGLHKIFPYGWLAKGLRLTREVPEPALSLAEDEALAPDVLTWTMWGKLSPYKSLYYETFKSFLGFRETLYATEANTTKLSSEQLATLTHYVKIGLKDLPNIETALQKIPNCFNEVVWIISPESEHEALESRTLVLALLNLQDKWKNHNNASENSHLDDISTVVGKLPILLWVDLTAYQALDTESRAVKLSFALGPLFIDGLIDGIYCHQGTAKDLELIYGILQATRRRISKVDYISCPSCGRTLFDLQEVTAKIKERTAHLKNIKIGIMGCIVNGPGEMADADYGYVGSGVDKITLYKGKDIVKRSIPEAEAVDALVELIREHGEWIEAPIKASVES